MQLNLFVIDAKTQKKIPAHVRNAIASDYSATSTWQTNWMSKAARDFPNKVALCRDDDEELLGLMSYSIDKNMLAVEIIYLENAAHSNSNLLHAVNKEQKYAGIARALISYAVGVSVDSGYDGIVVLKAKTTKLVEYYISEFGARHAGSYDPFRLIIWEDAAQNLLDTYKKED